ncbi:MAG: hypothetical protein M1835_006473 [Candelina submexicana]|nr:MAG: hypothetical protein M1835_006473 [Candelina submexicana]
MGTFPPFILAGLMLLAALSSALPSPQPNPTPTNADAAAAAKSSAAVASQFAAIASNSPQSGGGLTSGDVGNDPSKWSNSNSNAGASGTNTGFVGVSSGAQTAIIVVVVLVAVGGILSAILFYLAKKRQWKVRQSIRRSARRLTGTFKPSSSSSSSRTPQSSSRKQPGLARIPETPQSSTPRLAPAPKGRSALKVNTVFGNPSSEVEKGEKSKVQMSTFEISPTPAKTEQAEGEGKSWRQALWAGKGAGR